MSGRRTNDLDHLDPRLEERLRDVLGARDPGPAPRTLRERVDRVPGLEPRQSGRRSRTTSAIRAVAGLAAALLVVAVLVPMLAGRPSGPATSADPSAAGTPRPTTPPGVPFDYVEMAPYVVSSGGPSPLIDPLLALPVLLVVAAALALGAATARRVRRRSGATVEAGSRLARLEGLADRQLGIGWLVVLVAAGAVIVGPQPLHATVNGTGGSFLVAVDGTAPEDVFDGETTAPHPGQVSFQELTITNRGLLPVTIGQPATWDEPGLPIQPGRFVTARLTYEEALALPEPGPVLLWPGHSTNVRFFYAHLPCEAWGVPASPTSTPWPTIGPDGEPPVVPADTRVVVRTDLPLAASVLGVPRTLAVDTGYRFGVVVPDACPPSEPMAVADLSRVPPDLAMGNGWGTYDAGSLEAGTQTWILLVDGAVIALGFALVLWLLRRGRRLGAALVVGLAVAFTWWTLQPASLSSAPTGLTGQGQVAGGADGTPSTFDPEGAGVITFGFTLHNADAVPLTLVGVPTSAGQLRITGLGRPWGTPSATPSDNAGLMPGASLAAGGTMELLGQATAGSCARRLDGPHDAWIHLRAIPVTYERLGVRTTTVVPLGSSIRVPGDATCLASAAIAPDGREAWYPLGVPASMDDPSFIGPVPVALAVGIVVLLLVAWIRQRDRRRAAIALYGALALGAWWVSGLVVPVPMAVDDVVPDMGTVTNPNAGEQNALFVNAGPGQAFGFGLVLGTGGPLPVTVLGVSSAAGQGPWTGTWSSTVYRSGDLGAANQPIRPDGRLLGSELGLWITGTADDCAVPLPDPASPPQVPLSFTIPPVSVEVEVLGIRRTVELDPRAWPSMPLSTDCLDAAGRPS